MIIIVIIIVVINITDTINKNVFKSNIKINKKDNIFRLLLFLLCLTLFDDICDDKIITKDTVQIIKDTVQVIKDTVQVNFHFLVLVECILFSVC